MVPVMSSPEPPIPGQPEIRRLDPPVPLRSKIGWVATWAVMLVLLAMIARNCVGSVRYGTGTGLFEVRTYYALGHADGEAGRPPWTSAPRTGNALLIKTYGKGYRDGLDQAREIR